MTTFQTKNSTYKCIRTTITNAAITAQNKKYYEDRINVTKGNFISWKHILKKLLGAAESIFSPDTDTR